MVINVIICKKKVKGSDFLLGENIRKYRKSNDMSQDELAEKLNVTRQSISLWETGQTQPSIDNIIALSKLFNVSTDDLLTETNIKPTKGDTNMNNKNKKIILIIALIVITVLIAGALLWKFGTFDSENNAEAIYTTSTEKNSEDIFGYLKDFTVKYGTINGDYSYYSNTADNYGGNPADDFSLYYWGDTDTIEFCLHRVIDDTFSINFYLLVPKTNTGEYKYISSHYYRDNGEPLYEAKGTIKASDFTKNYPLTCTEYIGATEHQNEFMETSRIGICEAISCLEKFAQVEKLEYSFDDFGFSKF